jgi:hypothetical protein
MEMNLKSALKPLSDGVQKKCQNNTMLMDSLHTVNNTMKSEE